MWLGLLARVSEVGGLASALGGGTSVAYSGLEERVGNSCPPVLQRRREAVSWVEYCEFMESKGCRDALSGVHPCLDCPSKHRASPGQASKKSGYITEDPA
eukprot:4187335-Amphidinium_carterae.2